MNIKKIATVLACTAALFSVNSFAADNDLSNTLSSGYDLPSGAMQTFSASWFHTTNLKCKVRTTGGKENTVTALSLKNRIIVNGTILPEGHSTNLVLHAGDQLFFELDSRGKVGLTNNSDNLVNLLCK